jgi:hypothetical protein
MVSYDPLRDLLACGIPSGLRVQQHRWIIREPPTLCAQWRADAVAGSLASKLFNRGGFVPVLKWLRRFRSKAQKTFGLYLGYQVNVSCGTPIARLWWILKPETARGVPQRCARTLSAPMNPMEYAASNADAAIVHDCIV